MKEQEETNLEKGIKNMINSRMSQCRNSVLAAQIQKAIPGVKSLDKRNSLHAALDQISEELLLSECKEEKKVTFQLPKESVASDEITLQEIIIPNSEDMLQSDNFVRNLPIPIQDKKLYRKNILSNVWRSSSFVKFKDNLVNRYEDFLSWFDFWNDTFKVIEGQHGAAVLAYFLFLRWLLYMNMIIFLLNFLFIVTPQILFTSSDTDISVNYIVPTTTDDIFNMTTEAIEDISTEVYSHQYKDLKLYILFHRIDHVDHSSENITANSSMDVIIQHCKELYQQHIEKDITIGFLAAFQDLLQGTGPLETTHLFIGFYSPFNITPLGHVYNVSFAFICILLAIFVISFMMMIQYSSTGIQEAFMAQNTRANYYSNEIFSCWDYCIKDLTTAGLLHDKLVLELKTNLFEDRSRKRISRRSLRARIKINIIRLLINAFIIMWLFSSLYVIYRVVLYQMQVLNNPHLSKSGLWIFLIQYLSTTTMAVLNSISPTVFDMLINFEQYSSQTSANLSLVRNVFLYLSSIIILLNTVQSHVACKPKDLCGVGLDETCHSPRCWETYVGQQLYKLMLVDMAAYFAVFFCYDLVQYFITWNFDNAFTRYWGHPIFFLPTEVLAPIYSQTVLWLGVLYSPLLPLLMICKLIVIFYIKKVKILILCDPAQESYRASKFNSVFTLILLVSFFFVVMVHSYALENIPPSRGCGPFRYFQTMAEAVPVTFRKSLFFLMSHWFIAISTILLCCAIHYYWRILLAQKELVKRLRTHLVIQSFDKQFLLRSIPNLSRDKSEAIVD